MGGKSDSFWGLERLSGNSQAIKSIRKQAQIAASYDYPVLILGETGVGKTLVARIIHSLSQRSTKPFLHIGCSNISPNLMESELFGHERGAFTGAVERKLGKIEVANGGTLFLDEVADLNPQNQAKLLHFLESGIFFRIGGNEKLKADVRIITATNKNLLKEIKNNRFRQDLFYRLNILEIYIPPLRERKVDIPVMAETILKNEMDRINTTKAFLPETLNKLMAYDYPGNIRELENILKRAIIFSKDGSIGPEDIVFDEVYKYLGDEVIQSSKMIDKKYSEMVETGESFWEVIKNPFLRRELKREEVVEIISLGLNKAKTYKKLMKLFNAGSTTKDYKRFMKFIEYYGLNK
jgi:DNA-binding NtrC family response regulator